MSRRFYRAAAIATLLIGMLGCSASRSKKQFYVASTSEGYRVAVEACCYPGTVYISKPFSSPVDADILVQELNRDMKDSWDK